MLSWLPLESMKRGDIPLLDSPCRPGRCSRRESPAASRTSCTSPWRSRPADHVQNGWGAGRGDERNGEAQPKSSNDHLCAGKDSGLWREGSRYGRIASRCNDAYNFRIRMRGGNSMDVWEQEQNGVEEASANSSACAAHYWTARAHAFLIPSKQKNKQSCSPRRHRWQRRQPRGEPHECGPRLPGS